MTSKDASATATAASSSKAAQPVSQQEIVATYKAMRMELQRLASKAGELEAERDEHKMVLESIKNLEADRKCFRLMNGVLVERQVGKVVPQLQQDIENFNKAMENFLKLYKKKEQELADYQQKYGIRVEARPQGQQAEGASSSKAQVGLA